MKNMIKNNLISESKYNILIHYLHGDPSRSPLFGHVAARSFTDTNDMIYVMKKLHENDDFNKFIGWLSMNLICGKQIPYSNPDIYVLDTEDIFWLFNSPENFCWYVASWLEGRDK